MKGTILSIKVHFDRKAEEPRQPQVGPLGRTSKAQPFCFRIKVTSATMDFRFGEKKRELLAGLQPGGEICDHTRLFIGSQN
jgi:hypothetical protein